MNRRGAALFCAVLLMFVPFVLRAQDVAGRWQGTLDAEKEKLRIVIQIDRGGDGTLKGEVYSIDQTPAPQGMTTVSFAGSTLKFTVDAFHLSYEGAMSPDGRSIV